MASSANEIASIQEDLDRLSHWSEKWLMSFNVNKCKVMHLGYNNVNADYFLCGETLINVTEEKDLEVIIQQNLKVDLQCASAVKKANQILGMISRTFANKSKDIIVPLYKSLVRPHLEYCIQTWNPHY